MPLTENVPNEQGAWAENWTFGYLEVLYAALLARFRPALLGDAGDALRDESVKTVFVRHDIDVDLVRAAEFSRREVTWGVRSTYHVMIDSPFYDLRSAQSSASVDSIRALGHEVGLHYDVVARKMLSADGPTREQDIADACDTLEQILGESVRSVSFHLPVAELMRGPLRIAGRVSGYAEDLFRWYLSDSRGRWREGEPIASLDRPRGRVLQILMHPVWWGERDEQPDVRLRALLLDLAVETQTSFEALRDRMSDHILYRAADPSP